MEPHPLGIHRSLDPPGALPQAARRLDATPRAFDNEIAVSVEALNIDSASFRQMREAERATGETVESQVRRIVAERGKMHNPVTGSGGIFLGQVREVGPRHPASADLRPGERIASLVSLTLTPLAIERIRGVFGSSERVELDGTAILFERTLWARMPKDFPEEVALSAFDVAGAPASVRRQARPGDTVVVIGAGKAGLLCLAAARDAVGPAGRVFAVDPSEAASGRARGLGYADAVFTLDARDPVAVHAAVRDATRGELAAPRRERRQRAGDRDGERSRRARRRHDPVLRDGDLVLGGRARGRGRGAPGDAPDRKRLRPGPRRGGARSPAPPPETRRGVHGALRCRGVSAAARA